MTRQSSGGKFGNELEQRFRKQLNETDSAEDVKKLFARTAEQLLRQIMGKQLKVLRDDIELAPGESLGFRYSRRLAGDERFEIACEESDLMDILVRMASRALSRHAHLLKHPENFDAELYPPSGRY